MFTQVFGSGEIKSVYEIRDAQATLLLLSCRVTTMLRKEITKLDLYVIILNLVLKF